MYICIINFNASVMFMNKFRIIVLGAICLVSINTLAQNINQNQQNITIDLSNLPIIEKPVYIEKYRIVYKDRPQPKRVARRLPEPALLLGYLWVFPYDLGDFKTPPVDVIRNLNYQIPYDRNNWRIPTPGELSVMEAHADEIGLGDDIYLATDHRNGVLRLVSTGPTYTQIKAYEQQVEAAILNEKNIEYQQTHDIGVNINGDVWATRNLEGVMPEGYRTVYFVNYEKIIFSEKPESAGSWFSSIDDYDWINNTNGLPKGWCLPSINDFVKLFSQGGVYDLTNSCWRLGSLILPAVGWFKENQHPNGIVYRSQRGGRNKGYYLCSDGFFWFDLEASNYGYGRYEDIDEYGYDTEYTVRLIKIKNYNKYFD